MNLIPEKESVPRSHRRLRFLAMVTVGTVAVVLLVDGGLIFMQRKIHTDIRVLDQEIETTEQSLRNLTATREQASNTTNHLDLAQKILAAHVHWTPLFELLEKETLPTVYYRSMSGSVQTREFVFDVAAATSADIESQVALLRQSPQVESVSVHAASRGGDAESTTVHFRMNVRFAAFLFTQSQ